MLDGEAGQDGVSKRCKKKKKKNLDVGKVFFLKFLFIWSERERVHTCAYRGEEGQKVRGRENLKQTPF